MIIDAHIHIFSGKIVEKAAKSLKDTARIPTYTDFTEEQTRSYLGKWGVGLGVVLPIATKPAQQRVINDWAASVQHGNLICCGSVHPDAEDFKDELERIRRLGLYGIKLHPEYQEFAIDEERLFPLYESVKKLGLPLVVHAGFDPLAPGSDRSSPRRIARVHAAFPGLKLVAAHMGGVKYYDEVERCLVGTDVIFDTSMSPLYCSQSQFGRIVREHGPDKVLFASDLPWSSPLDEMDMVDRVRLTEEEREQVYWKNAARVFNIPGELLETAITSRRPAGKTEYDTNPTGG
jgi:predicted TIM-barrel fold metal-dependent hydrolase